jgi:chromosome segregation ATPase
VEIRASVGATLSTTCSKLEKSQAEAKATEAAMAEKVKRVTALERQNSELDKESNDLRESITKLEARLQSTQNKVAAEEGDKQHVMDELTGLRAIQDDLEKKLRDLAFLKETVRKLKEEHAIARRLDWKRRGICEAADRKGGECLVLPPELASPTANSHALAGRQKGQDPGAWSRAAIVEEGTRRFENE